MNFSKRFLIVFCVIFWAIEARAMLPEERGTSLQKNFSTPVRVLLAKRITSARFQSPGKLRVSIDNIRWFNFIGSVSVDKNNSGLRLNGRPLAISTLWIRTDTGNPIGFQAGFYTGTLRVYADKNELFVTQETELEDYVTNTVASEMPASWEKEALRAQAVASRSYVGFMKRHPRHRFYDVEGSTMDQAYHATRPSPAVIDAIQSTRGIVLTEPHSTAPAKALFHSRCGGHTEEAGEIWPSTGSSPIQPIGVKCPYCQSRPETWQAKISWRELLQKLSLPLSFTRPPLVTATKIASSGRVLQLSIATGKDQVELSGDQFRRTFGYQKIKSTLLRWERDREGIVLRGTGNGHGSGMCQWGARALARQGKDFREILAYFYPKARLRSTTASD